MKMMIRAFAILAWLVLGSSVSYAQTLTAGQAQKSAEADAFLDYEKALITGGLDAATPYMTPEKLAELNGMRKSFGEDGFKQFLDRMRGGARDMARRKQIEKVEVKGDYAVLEARDGPHSVTVQYLAKTKDGWKVDIRR